MIQGAGVDWPGPSTVTYSRPLGEKPPRPLKNCSAPGRRRRRRFPGTGIGRGPAPGRRQHATRRLDAIELIGQVAAAAQQNDTGDGQQQGAGLDGNQVAAQHVNAARVVLGAEMGRRPAGADKRFQGDLQVLDVRRAALVQDHEIDDQALQTPILAGPQQLADDGGILDLVDAHQHDRLVARYALRPQRPVARRDRAGSCQTRSAAPDWHRERGPPGAGKSVASAEAMSR